MHKRRVKEVYDITAKRFHRGVFIEFKGSTKTGAEQIVTVELEWGYIRELITQIFREWTFARRFKLDEIAEVDKALTGGEAN